MSNVFILNRAISVRGVWHPTGGSRGTLYATLALAQASIPRPWVKDEKRRIWRTPNGDIISAQKVNTK